MRNYGHAIFLTPDDLASWKSSARSMLASNKVDFDAFLDLPWNTLGVIWGTTPSDWNSYADYSRPRWQTPMWQTDFLIMAVTSIANSKVLRGAAATSWDTLTDRLSLPVVRQINEAQAGEWRAIPYAETIGDVVAGPPKSINMGAGDWGAMRRSDFTGPLPPVTGPWLNFAAQEFSWDDGKPDNLAGYSYWGTQLPFVDVSHMSGEWHSVPADRSVWDDERPIALTMPVVKVPSSPKGLPIAATRIPTRTSISVPRRTGVNP
jgi:hypothetical protein